MQIKVNCEHFEGFTKCNLRPRSIFSLWLLKPVCELFNSSLSRQMTCKDQVMRPRPNVPPPAPLRRK